MCSKEKVVKALFWFNLVFVIVNFFVGLGLGALGVLILTNPAVLPNEGHIGTGTTVGALGLFLPSFSFQEFRVLLKEKQST